MKKRPNVLLINTHDSGRLFGCYGVQEVSTPHIDTLAAEGFRLSNFFATCPICSPSRASLTTGRYPTSHGVIGGCHAPDFNRLGPNEKHLSHILSAVGYHCESFGLTHESRVGDALGFHRKNLEIRPTLERYSCEILTPAVIDFFHRQASCETPFYAQVGFFETHQPFDFGGIKPDTSNGIHMPGHLLRCPENEQKMALLQGGVKKVDQAVGAMLEGLRTCGLEENTMVIFTVDHGIEMPRAKFTLYDPGLHVPLIMRWPQGGVSGGSVYDGLTSCVDVLPTLLDLLEFSSDPRIEGVSFADAISHPFAQPHREYVFAGQYGGDARMIRSGRYKLIRNFSARKLFSPPVDPKTPFIPNSTCPLVELYDLQNDPNEFIDVAALQEYADVKRMLDVTLWQWMHQITDPIFRGAVPHRMWAEAMSECPIPLNRSEKGNG